MGRLNVARQHLLNCHPHAVEFTTFLTMAGFGVLIKADLYHAYSFKTSDYTKN